MEQEYVTLKWGDIVRIMGVNYSTKRDTKKGLIISKGFTDSNVYYQLYDDFSQVNFYRESLFQILPQIPFDIHNQLQDQDLEAEVKQNLKNKAQSQIVALESALHAKVGKDIKFGSEVVFRHVESKSYLKGVMKAADIGEGAFKVEISQNLSSSTVFKIKSHRTYENENDKVHFDDSLQIYHPSSDTYMNFDEKYNPISLDFKEELKEIPNNHYFRQFSDQRPSIKRPTDIRISIINENKSKCLWKFVQHCNFEQYNNKSRIKSHDIVYFKHTKKNEESLVCTTISKQLEPYLKQNLNGSLSYDCFWELIPKQVNEFNPEECKEFWARSIVTGELLKYQNFKVEIKKNSEVKDQEEYDNQGLINLICTEDSKKLERGEQQLIGRENIHKIVEEYESKFKKIGFQAVKNLSKDIFMICKVEEDIMLDAQYVLSAHEPLIKFVEKLSSSLLDQKESFFEFSNFFMELNQDLLLNTITIMKLLISRIFGTEYENIGSGKVPNKNVQRVLVEAGITQILIQIIYYLYEPFKFIERNKQPSQDRAIRLKVSQIFELTYILLQKIAVGCEDNRIYLSRWIYLFLQHSKGANKSYIQQCLVGILQNNPKSISQTIDENKIKDLIDCFLKEARQAEAKDPLTTKYLRLFSTFIKCEGEVIQENQNIILNKFFLNPNNQFNFRFKMEEKTEQKNQSSLEEPESQHKNQSIDEYDDDPFKIRYKEAHVSLGKAPYISFVEFFRLFPQKWNYLLAYVDLLADVCSMRNNIAIESVSSIISLQSVAVILFDPSVLKINDEIREKQQKSKQQYKENKEQNKEQNKQQNKEQFSIKNIHAPFVRIAHHAYVNNQKFQPIKRIKKISKWYRNEQHQIIVEEINKTKRVFQGEKDEEEERHLQSILEYITTFIRNCNQDVHNLEMLKIVLDLLKETIILGLWRSINLFRELAPMLVTKIIKIEKDSFFQRHQQASSKTLAEIVQINKENLMLKRPEIAKCIECKIIATQIFKYMNELEIDIRLRYLMNFFKGLYQTTEDFNIYDLPIDEDQDDSENNTLARQEYMKMDGKALFGDRIMKITEDVDVLQKENLWYHKLKQLTPFEYEKNQNSMKDRFMFQGDIADIGFNNLVLALFELPIYQNYKLLNCSLNMLRSMFKQRRDLLYNFNKILICGKGNMNEVYITLKLMRAKFKMLTNANIMSYSGDNDKNFSYEIKKSYDCYVKDREKRSGIIEDLFFLTRTLKDGTSLNNIEQLMKVDDDAFIIEVYMPIDEREKNNQLFQSLNLAEQIYTPLIEYIKIVGNTHLQVTSIHRKLLLSIYQYLTMLCFNNLQAKQIMMQYIPCILPHLPKKVGAAGFLYEVTRNNKLLVSNYDMVSLIIQKSLESCITLQQNFAFKNIMQEVVPNFNLHIKSNDYEKSRIFFALRGIIIYNDCGYKENQQLLMNRLQDLKFSKLIFQGTINLEPQKISNFNLSPEETYLTHHFQLFSLLVQSNNLINIGKLENLHPYHYCLDCLMHTNRWQLRRALRSYINRLYYVNKDKDIFLFEKFIRMEFDILNKQLGDFIQLHKSKLLTDNLKIKNGIRFSFAQSQIFLFIIEVLITLHEMFLKPQFLDILRRQIAKEEKNQNFQPLHEKMIKLFKYIGCLKKIYDDIKIITSFVMQIKRLMTIELERLHIRFLEKKCQPKQETKEINEMDKSNTMEIQIERKNYSYDQSKSFFKNLNEMIKFLKAKEKLEKLKDEFVKQKNVINVAESEMKKRYIQSIFDVTSQNLKKYHSKKNKRTAVTQYDPHLQTACSKIYKVLAKPELNENAENIELNQRLTNVKKIIQDSPIFDKFVDDQFVFLVKKCMEMNETSAQLYSQQWQAGKEDSKAVISFHQMISQTFKLIMQHPNQIDDNQKIFIIKLVRYYLTEAVEEKQSYKLPVDKWEADYCADNKELFKERQIKIQECGGSDFIISILEENLSGRIELLNEVLLFGIAYLFGGNTTCQDSILESLKKDPENTMLYSMRNLIKRIGDFLINVRKIKQNEKIRNYKINIVDTYDYFSLQDRMISKYFGQKKIDMFENQTELNYEKIICRLFRFLQLFAQNNNIKMKEFLSQQINQDDSKKTNSINFIDQACLLLKKLYKVMNMKLVMLPKSLLGFIGEITQVPILKNQTAFIKSTYFQDISYMSEFFEKPENRQLRKFNIVASQDDDDPLNSLYQIYQTSVQLALINFEGNDPIIIKQFLNKCQPRLLWLITRDQLWNLIKTRYSNKSFVIMNRNQQSQNMLATFKNMYIEDFNEIIHEEKKNQEFDGPILSIIEVYIILKKIADYEEMRISDEAAYKACLFKNQYLDNGKAEFPQFAKIYQSLKDLVYQIQVNCFNGETSKLQFIYFPNHPVFYYLASKTKDSIMTEVKRDTSRDKLISLLDFRDEVYEEIKSNFDRDHNGKINILGLYSLPMSITSQISQKIREYARYFSFIIIVLMFFSIYVEHDLNKTPQSHFTFLTSYEDIFLRLLCIVQLTLSIFFFILWYQMRGTLAIRKYTQSIKKEEKQEGGGQEQEEQEEDGKQEQQKVNYKLFKILWQLIKVMVKNFFIEGWKSVKKLMNLARKQQSIKIDESVELVEQIEQAEQEQKIEVQKKEEQNIEQQQNKLAIQQQKSSNQLLVMLKTQMMIQKSNFINWLLNYYYNSRIYNSFLLKIWALCKIESQFIPIVIFICTAIIGNFYGIEWYTLHLFDFFVSIPRLANIFKSISQNSNDLFIFSVLVATFILVFNILSLSTYVPAIYEDELPKDGCDNILGCVETLYTSGVIGEGMGKFNIGRFSFEMLYVIFMSLLFQNIVGGIIIDGYQALLDEDNTINSDKKGCCYICSKTKAEIEKKEKTSFKKHTANKHFLWNYLFYIYCLLGKDETDYSGIEYIISQKIQQEDVDWFPVVKQEDSDEKVEKMMNTLKENINEMTELQKKALSETYESFEQGLRSLKKLKQKINNQNLQNNSQKFRRSESQFEIL